MPKILCCGYLWEDLKRGVFVLENLTEAPHKQYKTSLEKMQHFVHPPGVAEKAVGLPCPPLPIKDLLKFRPGSQHLCSEWWFWSSICLWKLQLLPRSNKNSGRDGP